MLTHSQGTNGIACICLQPRNNEITKLRRAKRPVVVTRRSDPNNQSSDLNH